jgi:ABC-type amino acid transport substrate-binding protein
MTRSRKRISAITCALISFGLMLFCVERVFSQNSGETPRPLIVGVMVSPPISMKTAENRWEGFSVELWEAVAQRAGIPFEFLEFSRLGEMLDALEKGTIDVVPALPVQEWFEATMDFSQSYLKSGLSIAVPARDVEYRWIRVFQSIFSKHVLKAIGLLMVMSMIFGIIVWFFERRRNNDMFGGKTLEGIGHGIWWATVTMTTVGYGDKAPKTTGGRIIALIWMIFSIVFIACLTADITASLTIRDMRGKVTGFHDLFDARVGSIPRSEGFNFLTREGIAPIPFESLQEGLQAVAGRKIDAFVLNEQILKHLVKNEFPGGVQVLSGTYDEYFVSVALKQNSPMRKPINKALLKFMKTQEWAELLNRYFK